MLKKINNRYCLWSDESGDYVIDVEGNFLHVASVGLTSFFPKKGYRLRSVKQRIIESSEIKSKLDIGTYGGVIVIIALLRGLLGYITIENTMSRSILLVSCFILLIIVRILISINQKKIMNRSIDYGEVSVFDIEYKHIRKRKRFVNALFFTLVLYLLELVSIVIFINSGDFLIFISAITFMIVILSLGQFVIPNSKSNHFGVYFIKNKKRQGGQ